MVADSENLAGQAIFQVQYLHDIVYSLPYFKHVKYQALPLVVCMLKGLWTLGTRLACYRVLIILNHLVF